MKSQITINDDTPVYTIGKTAELLGISIATLRLYEKEGLILPFKRASRQRLYSKSDIDRITLIRRIISEKKISINGLKAIYSLIPCWEIVNCPEEERNNCVSFSGANTICWVHNKSKSNCSDTQCRTCEIYVKFNTCNKIKEVLLSLLK